MNEVIQEGRNKEEALKAALEKLGVTREDVDVEVLETHREGLFGFIGSRPVKIRVFLKQHDDSNFNRIEEDFEDEIGHVQGNPHVAYPDNVTPEDVVKDFVTKVFSCLEVKCDIEVIEGENNIYVDIGGDDSGVIIGKFGQTLDALQFLTNVIMTKKYGNKKKILVNVGDYRQRRETSVKKLARSVARKVLKSKKPEALAPMPPQDRRIVHLTLSTYDHIATTSEGTGKNRKVIISYKD